MSTDRIPRLARELLDEAEAVACLPPRTVELVQGIGQGLRIRHRAQVVEAARLLLLVGQREDLRGITATSGAVGRCQPRRISLAGLQYFATPSRTPCQELADHARRELGLERVQAVELGKVRVPRLVNPVALEQLSLSRADHELLTKATRAWSLAATGGDAAAERRLFRLRRNGPPYVDPNLGEGVALYFPPDDI